MVFVICLFIIQFNIKSWLNCTVPVKAPASDFNFIKDLKLYEKEH